MAAIFDSQPGRLITLPIDGPQSFTLSFNDRELPGIATQVNGSGQVSAQILTSLANTVHVTAFGDKPGQLTIAALLNDPCGVTPGTTMKAFLDFYQNNRLSGTQGGSISPLLIVVGSEAYQGFLLSYNTLLASEGSQLMTGQLMFATWRL